MKEYRLAAWPDLDALHDRIAYRRMLSDMSQRYVSQAQLAACSGLSRNEVARFLSVLEGRGLIAQRDCGRAEPLFGSLRPFGAWLRRAIGHSQIR